MSLTINNKYNLKELIQIRSEKSFCIHAIKCGCNNMECKFGDQINRDKCQKMKNIIKHEMNCNNDACIFDGCDTVKLIQFHINECSDINCVICSPNISEYILYQHLEQCL